MTHANAVTAYFDALCPICRHEMDGYTRLAPDMIRLHDCNGALPDDVDREAALASLHVRLPDGELVSGWLAFLAIWDRLPKHARLWRLLAWLTRPAPIRVVVNRLYLWLAPMRPRQTCRDDICARPD